MSAPLSRPSPTRLAVGLLTVLLLLLGAAPNASPLTAAGRSLVLHTTEGSLRGISRDGTDQLLGVRYAAAPTGDLRWRSPAAPPSWTGIRTADKKGAACPQQGVEGSEDCLFVNVYRPERPHHRGPLPVFVWLHGGGFTGGSGNDFDPVELVTENDIVVVTVNYRLGALGFLAAPALDTSSPAGNYGLLDQQAALRWVKANIGGWDGDTSRVTLAGESAGGGSVCAQLASPRARGLFSAAVIESDDCIHDVDTYEEAQARASAVVKALDCDLATPAQTAACLRDADSKRIVAATGYIAPNISGVLPLLPATAIATGRWNKMPVLMGSNREEGRAFATDHLQDTQAGYERWLATAPAWPPMSTGAPVFGNAETARAIAKEYPLSDFPEPYPAAYAIAAVITDSGTRGLGGCTSLRTARAISTQQPVYYYQFQDPHPPRMADSPAGYDYAAAHAYELPYLFPRLSDSHGVPYGDRMTSAQRRLAHSMRAAWADFARGSRTARPLGNGWRPLGPLAHRDTYLPLQPGSLTSAALDEYAQQHHCELWDRVTP
ncbi:carboxylesterase family protein [Streptomyces sp. NPDC026672]|uniref:carboxylesterase/lipase family protein n=1 Tax=unclassified Streptomyces TaxID=2593676 RepID=UPI003406830E